MKIYFNFYVGLIIYTFICGFFCNNLSNSGKKIHSENELIKELKKQKPDELVLSDDTFNVTKTPPCGMPPDLLHGAATLGDSRSTIWPNGIVYYEIDRSSFNNQHIEMIKEGLRMVETQTKIDGQDCIKFVERTTQSNWIRVINDRGCYSMVGRFLRPGAQQLSLEIPGCLGRETVAHEFIHAMGFNHEQTRPDRDQWIEIYYSNIPSPMKHNFDISENYQDLGTPYDYSSIMHYEETAFAKDARYLTMKALKPPYRIKRNKQLSNIDIEEIRKIYNCKPKKVVTTTTSTTTTKTTTTSTTRTSTTTTTTRTTTTTTTTTSTTTQTTSTATTTLSTENFKIIQRSKFQDHYTFHKVESLNECWEICKYDQGDCKAISLDNYNMNCYLYDKITLNTVFDKYYTSYVLKKGASHDVTKKSKILTTIATSITTTTTTTKSTKPTTTTETLSTSDKIYDIFNNTRFSSHYIYYLVDTLEHCWLACGFDFGECKAISYDYENKYCYLFDKEVNELLKESKNQFMSYALKKGEKHTISKVSVPEVSYKVHEKTRFHDHYMFYHVETIENCWRTCTLDDGGCKAITFYHPFQYCYLYNIENPSSSMDPQFTSYTIKKETIESVNYIHLNKTRLTDYFKKYKAKSLKSCWSKCNKNKDKCIAAFYHHKNGTCYLSDKINKKDDKAYTTLLPLNKSNPVTSDNDEPFEQLDEVRLIGHYKEVMTKDVEECWKECEDELACNAVTFLNEGFLNEDKNCFFFTSKEPKRKNDNKYSSIIRKKSGPLDINFEYFEFPDTVFEGYYKLLITNSITECWKTCDSKEENNCKAISYKHSDKSCFLYRMLNLQSNREAGYTSYVRTLLPKKDEPNEIDYTIHKKTRLHGHFKELTTLNEKYCWDKCNEEQICNAITYYNFGFLNFDKNCFLYEAKNPNKSEDEEFTSFIRKTKFN